MRTLLAAIVLISACCAYAGPLIVIYPKGQSSIDTRRKEVVELIRLSLQKTEKTHGPFILKPANYVINPLRQVADIKKNQKDHINIVWIDTNKKIEKELLPIYIPIQKGIVGYRVFLIRNDSKNKFTKSMTLDDLQKLSNGIGLGWMDQGVFELNKLNYVIGYNYEGLFKMLSAKRFDYFSRGINEAFPELEDRKKLYPDMSVEQNIALSYRHPIYLFTSKQRVDLHDRLETGFNMMIKDDSFNKTFCKYNKSSIEKANLRNRKIFKLEYHLPIPESVEKRRELWFDPMVDICQ